MTTDAGDLFRRFDLFEATMWIECYIAADDATVETCGIAARRLDGAVLTAAARFDVLAYNRALGLGLDEPATEAVLDEIVAFYTAARAPRFFVQVSPHAVPAELPSWLEARGLKHHNNWVKLYRRIGDVAEPETDLRIEEAHRADADTVARIVGRSFDMPETLGGIIASSVGRSAWRFYLAYDGATPIAAGGLFVEPPLAALAMAGTLSEFRGRGAQGALIQRRLCEAASLGAEIATVETAEPTEGKDVPSNRNMLRYGFEVAYVRPNYVGVVAM